MTLRSLALVALLAWPCEGWERRSTGFHEGRKPLNRRDAFSKVQHWTGQAGAVAALERVRSVAATLLALSPIAATSNPGPAPQSPQSPDSSESLESPESPEAELVWYFGIGSMMSPVALGMRGVRPVQSVLCDIQGYRKVFYANEGMATLVQENGCVAHAIAHRINRTELAILEAREPPSVPVSARLRGDALGDEMVHGVSSIATNFVFLEGVHADPDQVKASVEQEMTGARGRITLVTKDGIHVSTFASPTFDTNGTVRVGDHACGVPLSVSLVPPVPCKPSARYLDLMLEGARAVGMGEDELATLAATPCVPRKSTHELRRLPFNDTARSCLFSKADVENDTTLRVIRGRVFRLPKALPSFGRAGADLAVMASTQMRDPLYGSPPSDPTEAWDGWDFVEDMLCSFLPEDLTHVGFIELDPQ